MKKAALLILLGVFVGGNAFAEEMIVHLKSGNSLVIQYTGTIERVTLEGHSDAITGMIFHNADKGNGAMTSSSARLGKDLKSGNKTTGAKATDLDVKWKWASPKMED